MKIEITRGIKARSLILSILNPHRFQFNRMYSNFQKLILIVSKTKTKRIEELKVFPEDTL